MKSVKTLFCFVLFFSIQIEMEDINTGELLEFPCNRWMSREEDDGEICRELPVMKDGEQVYPGKKSIY